MDYKKILDFERVGRDGTNRFWDDKAESYYESQQKGNKALTEEVVSFLNEKGLIKGRTLLDIGGGTGRYAIPFAKTADKVVVADVSKEMMNYARDYQKKENVYNIYYLPFDWQYDDLRHYHLYKNFDVAFGAMSPPLRHIEGLEKMMEATREQAIIMQYVKMTDTVIDFLKEKLGLTDQYDPHNDIEYAEALVAYLKDHNYPVNTHDFKEFNEEVFTVDEAVKRYRNRFESIADNKGFRFEELIQSLASNDQITVKKENVLRAIWWNVRS